MKKTKLFTLVLMALLTFAPLGCKKEPAADSDPAGTQTQNQQEEHTHEPGEEHDHEH